MAKKRFYIYDLWLINFRDLSKEISAVEKEIFYVEKSLHQSKIDLENLKSIQEEKEETLRVMTRALKEEEKKIERAKVIIFLSLW